MMTKIRTSFWAVAIATLSANVWAAAPEPDFLYKGNGNGTIQGWFTGWDGEGFADARRAIGPGDYGLVYAVDHVNNNVKWHPYKGYRVPETFSLAMYTDLSAVTNGAADKAVMVAVGGNSGNHATLYKMGDKVKLDYNDGTLETAVPAGGYHLYTMTYSPSAITLSVDSGDAVSVAGTFSQPNNGFQIGGVYGGVGSYSNPTGLPVAAVLGFNKALTAEEVAELAQAYPATTESSYSNGSYNTNDGRLFAGTINQNGFIEVKRGTLVVPAGAHYQVKAIGFGDAQGETQGFGLELDGNMTITGTSAKDGNGSGGVKSGVESNEGGFLGGEWEGVGTYNIRGTLSIPNSYMQLVYDANAQTYNIENGGQLIVKGIQANKGAGNKARSSHVINVKNGGLLKVSTALSRGTLNAAIEDGGVLELADCVNATLTDSNLGGITGDGKLRLTGSNWVELPTDTTKAANLASIAEIENNLANGLLMKEATTYTIGSLSGTGTFRYDWGSNARTLVVKQSKNTIWSGNVYNSTGHSNSNRALNMTVTSDNGSVLSVGTVSGSTATLTAGEGGTINITGSCAGVPVVLDGGTIQTPGARDAHGTMLKNLTLKQDGAYVWSGTGDGFIGIGANAQNSKLDLDGHTLTLTGKNSGTRVYLDKVTEFPNAGTINVTKGKLFLHCASIAAPEGTKLVIGSDASIEADNQTLSITELEYNGTATSTAGDMCMVTVTSKLSGTGTINKLTLADGVEVRGQVTVSTTATLNGTIKLMEEDATLKVPAVIEGWETKVLSGVDTKKVAYDAEEKKFSLVIDDTPHPVATMWKGTGYEQSFTSFDKAIEMAQLVAEQMSTVENEVLPDLYLTVPFTSQIPDGYELVFGRVKSETEDRYYLQKIGQVADYIVISPRNYVTDWTTYVTERAKSPVAAGITFAVKAADEIYAAYPANADNVNGDPRNDAESIHKYIGMMQAKGAKYFVLGGRWVDVQAGSYDRTTLIPGIAVYPKAKKPAGFNLDTIASDLYYACHYKADGQNYVWDPNGDKIYVGLCENSPDQMEDVRHFQPNCVVSRMNFFADTYGGSAKTYSDLIAAYTTKLQHGEGNTFAGADRYMVWSSRCEKDVGDKPDCYPAQKARADYIPTVRAANEIYFSYLLNSQTVEQVNELRSTVLGQDWEILIPVEHGSAEGLGNLQCDHIKASNQIIKFFMGNVPCLTGQVSANGCFSDVALSNPNGGTLVSINNTSYGYASTSGMAGRKCGVSDEIVDWCLDHYLDGSTAGEAWRYAIDQYTSIMLDENGFKDGVLEARGHDGVEANGTPEKVYVFAAFLEQMLFGDPLVKIQTEPGASSLVATVSHPAKLTYHSLPDALRVAATDSAANTIGLFRTANVDAALTVAAEDVLEIESGKGLIAKGGLTVKGTLSGAGTISGAVTFGARATLDASGASKLSLAAGSSLTVAESGVNLILPSGTTAIPAATTMVVMNQSDLTGTWKVASAKAAGSNSELSGTIELIAANDAIFVIDSSNVIKLDSIQTGKGAVIESVVIVNGKDETPAVMESKKYFLIPSGATIKVTCRPDLDHSGAEQTITVENVTSVGTVTGAMTGYASGRAPATVFVDGDSDVTYTGDMLNKVLLPEGEATSGTYVEHRTSIVAGDTVVFDVAHHLDGKTVVVMSDAAGAELHIDANLTMIPGEAAAILGGKRVDVQDGHTLTLKPTDDYDLTLGSGVSFNGGTVKMTTDNAAKFIKTDSLEGASLIDIRSPLVIKPPTDAGTIAWSGRLTGNGTIEGAVAVHAGAHLIVRGTEYLTVPNLTSHEHRLTIDAMASTPVKGGDGKYQPLTVLKVANKATAEALIPNLTLVEPELTHADGKRVLFQLAATDDGSIVMKELEFVIIEGFFTNGVLGHNKEVVWKHDSTFASGDYGISVTCPAEIAFDFTGAGSEATITVAKPITLSGSGALTFDVPTGRTVYVNCTITGNAGVTKTGGGTLIFGLPEGMTEEGGLEGENVRAGWNTFYGALTVEEGTVRSTKGHGYGARHVVDGETDVPEIEIHSGATLDLAHICDQEMLEIITAGTITNSYHHATGATVGQIKQLTLKGDATVTGHTFGMAHDSIINLQGHVLTISMERGECVTETIAPEKTEVRDHEFELNNTKVLGGRDNLATPDIIVRQGTLSCEGSAWDGVAFTMGDNDLLDAALYVGAEGCLRLDANLTVKRIQMVNGNKDVVVPCDENPDGTPAEAHTHTFKKVWEESLKPDADPTSDADNKYFGHIIIRQELKGGISAPRLTLGRIGDPTKSLHDADDDMNSREIRRIVLDKGEYIDCQQEFVMTAGKIGSQFNVFFLDWTGESGARRIFHGWEKFSHDLSLSEILNPYGVKPKADGGYRLMLGDWYPYGAYAFADDPVDVVNTLPLEDQNWAYAISLWPYVEDGEERPYDIVNTLITTITHLDGEPLYNPELNDGVHDLYDNVLVTTNGLLKCYCQRGDGKMDFVIGEAWIKQYMGADKYYEYMGEAMYLGGNGTISKWLNAKGANGIERWQSYMLGLDPTRADSLPVLAVRTDVAPSVQKTVDGVVKTFVNVKVAGTSVYGYQYISPVYSIEELNPATMEPIVMNETTGEKHTPWQSSVNFQVEVPTKADAQGRATPAYDHVKYFRVNVSFQGNDGITN